MEVQANKSVNTLAKSVVSGAYKKLWSSGLSVPKVPKLGWYQAKKPKEEPPKEEETKAAPENQPKEKAPAKELILQATEEVGETGQSSRRSMEEDQVPNLQANDSDEGTEDIKPTEKLS